MYICDSHASSLSREAFGKASLAVPVMLVVGNELALQEEVFLTHIPAISCVAWLLRRCPESPKQEHCPTWPHLFRHLLPRCSRCGYKCPHFLAQRVFQIAASSVFLGAGARMFCGYAHSQVVRTLARAPGAVLVRFIQKPVASSARPVIPEPDKDFVQSGFFFLNKSFGVAA